VTFLRTFCLVAIGLLAALEIEDARVTRDVRGSYAPRAPREARASIWGRPRSVFSECAWDNVAFRREEGKDFCSSRCEAMHEASLNRVSPGEAALIETETVAPLLHVPPKRRTNLTFYDRRASKRKSERLTERALAKLMRTDAEARFAPVSRIVWIDTNLAVLR